MKEDSTQKSIAGLGLDIKVAQKAEDVQRNGHKLVIVTHSDAKPPAVRDRASKAWLKLRNSQCRYG